MTDKVFSGVRAQWLPLYEKLRAQASKALEPFEEHRTSSAVIWRHTSSFAEFSARKDCLVAAFPSDTAHSDWGAAKIVQTSKNRAVHYFELTGSGSLRGFTGKLKAAYSLTKTARPPSRSEDTKKYNTIDEYIALFSPPVQKMLGEIRSAIREAAPDAVEKLSWQMPTFWQNENLIHFAAAKNHIGIYPGAEAIEVFAADLKKYASSKGAFQLPLTEPVPRTLIKKIVKFRVKAATAN
jgi:uncharacterized protein YdhG (YjbR/CyaY superfamily)